MRLQIRGADIVYQAKKAFGPLDDGIVVKLDDNGNAKFGRFGAKSPDIRDGWIVLITRQLIRLYVRRPDPHHRGAQVMRDPQPVISQRSQFRNRRIERRHIRPKAMDGQAVIPRGLLDS